VTCLTWPRNKPHDLIFGLAEGKVKVGQLRSNKAQTLYSLDNYVVAVSASMDGDQVLSGHLDGSIYKYNIETQQAVKIVQHGSPPYALDWGEHICAAGNDSRVIFYKEDGSVF
jgi:intraflagellar transport protein 172